ncbi:MULTISPECIES: Fur family transcriptional regulator [Bifidobacterium]|uniref:Transcriptional repressor n=1 Tax=Bifidobacterium tibiigranuli TaxID=2172043 RepID=A0A5N6RZ17_9BIFI|nr:transcriptional repressor [Bifidobacterium tibiigranuli]KAE8127229.1 transcriptional repressor [Bifidobacterium tibiigranuli]KAE8127686.1 transcriptional repressor [Bifidobacterium tibiigranuli]MCI1211232.1 transcriptional repressor [Bifidobacterium tibiigranuli]MCI1221355.1 transcriptional repressor [Bifidobacterium tibiigranuli]MCI1232373.1 transcriptional repressor [Bifidobacterium tibiigranuli]
MTIQRNGGVAIAVKKPAERHTKQKDAVLQALRGCEDFVSAQDLHRQLAEQGEHIGLATVYRQLNGLAAKGRADTIRLNEQQMFRICDESGHHHHLVCEQCGRTVEIDPPDENWLRKVAQEHGYTVISHTVEVFGLCPDCQAMQAQE